MWRVAWKKVRRKKGQTLTHLVGMILVFAFVSAIPLYTNGALTNVIAQMLTSADATSSSYPPGTLTIRYQAVGKDVAEPDAVKKIFTALDDRLPQEIGMPLQEARGVWGLRSQTVEVVKRTTTTEREGPTQMVMGVLALDLVDPGAAGLTFFDGRLPRDTLLANDTKSGQDPTSQTQDDTLRGTRSTASNTPPVLEVMASRELLQQKQLVVGDTLAMTVSTVGDKPTRKRWQLKIVGAFDLTDDAPLKAWPGENVFKTSLFVHPATMSFLLTEGELPLTLGMWYKAFDLPAADVKALYQAQKTLQGLDLKLTKQLDHTRTEVTFLDLLETLLAEHTRLKHMLFVLAAPVLALLFYFIWVNMALLVEGERQEIALLNSRGARLRQLFALYAWETGYQVLFALPLGLSLGYVLTQLMGRSSGFMVFVLNRPFPVSFTTDIAVYLVGAVVLILAMKLTLLYKLRHISIIVDRQKQSKRSFLNFGGPLVELALLAITVYGYYALARGALLADTRERLTETVDPLLFFIPALAILTLVMIFLRIFPVFLRLLLFLTRRTSAVSIELALTQLTRAIGDYTALMRLLAVTLGLGLYAAEASRTIEMNWQTSFIYTSGADAVIQAQWETMVDPASLQHSGNAGSPLPGGGNAGPGGAGSGSGAPVGAPGNMPGGNAGGDDRPSVRLIYREPPFELFQHLPGVQSATRVLKRDVSIAVGSKGLGKGKLMAIDNADFARTARFVPGLYRPYHPYEYLKLLGEHEAAAIVSKKWLDQYDLKPGEVITLSLNQKPADFIIFAAVDYWPTMLPKDGPFFIVNLPYVQDVWPLEPYDIWVKMRADGSLAEAVQRLLDQNVPLIEVTDYRSMYVQERKSPFLGGVFGTLSLNFVLSLFASLVGYMLYTYFMLAKRRQTFGLLRASGLTRGELIRSLIFEQFLSVGAALLFGLAAGSLVSWLFLPFLKKTFQETASALPFQVYYSLDDLLNLGLVALVLLILSVLQITMRTVSLRLGEVLKLGADR